jgi:uncharacterized protein YdeI (YjbR/CyaY-like superfamily)
VGRQIRFEDVKAISRMKPVLKAFINQAIKVEKGGTKIKPEPTVKLKLPEELKIQLNKTPALKKAFEKLTPGRQRGYAIYFSSAKHAETRISRIEKYKKQILKGKGLHDR